MFLQFFSYSWLFDMNYNTQELSWQVDISTLDNEGAAFDLPDGLIQFRMNLVELLVDICQLLGSVIYTKQVHFYWEWLKEHEDLKAFILKKSVTSKSPHW